MNPLLSEAAASVEGGWLLGVMTALFLATFLYWLWYAYAPSHKQRLEAAGKIPFENETEPLAEGADQ